MDEVLRPVEELLNGDEGAVERFFADQTAVFHVDWRELDEQIAEYCSTCLRHYEPDAPAIVADLEGDRLFHVMGDRREHVPLTYSPRDRHLTLIALNALLEPKYEIRRATDSDGSDTLSFVAMSRSRWSELESCFGDAVEERFARLVADRDTFGADEEPVARRPTPRPQKPWWKFWG